MHLKKVVFIFFIFILSVVSASAQNSFIKYKKYLIPISSCNPFNANKNGVPSVFYMNDVGYSSDPDGVFDVPIVVAWHKAGLINLLGIGASNPSNADKQLIQNLVNRSVESNFRPPVYSQSEIPDKLIELAQSESCLHIAIGGSWEQLVVALEQLENSPAQLSQFISRVSVSAVGSTNIGTTDEELVRVEPNGSIKPENLELFEWYQSVKEAFGLNQKLVRLDRGDFGQSYPNDFSNDLNFGALNTRPKRRAVDDWLDDHFLNVTRVGRYIRDYGNSSTNFIERNDDRGVRFLQCDNRYGSSCPKKRWGDKDDRGTKVRIADFNSIAYLIWGVSDETVDYDSSMKAKLESAWSHLIP